MRGSQYPDAHKPILQGFAKEAQNAREKVWETAISENPAKQAIPRYMPVLSEGAFTGLKLPEGTKVVPAMVDIPVDGNSVGTDAAVAIHPKNNCCLIEFNDHTAPQQPTLYAVSRNKPPMEETNPDVRLFNSAQEALNHWNNGWSNPQDQEIFNLANELSVSNTQDLSTLTSVIKDVALPKEDHRRYTYKIPLQGLDEKVLWDTIKLKARSPQKFVEVIKDCKVIEEMSLGFVRKASIKIADKPQFDIHEKVFFDEKNKAALFVQADGDFLAINEIQKEGENSYFSGTYMYGESRSREAFEAELTETFANIKRHSEA